MPSLSCTACLEKLPVSLSTPPHYHLYILLPHPHFRRHHLLQPLPPSPSPSSCNHHHPHRHLTPSSSLYPLPSTFTTSSLLTITCEHPPSPTPFHLHLLGRNNYSPSHADRYKKEEEEKKAVLKTEVGGRDRWACDGSSVPQTINTFLVTAVLY